MRYTIGRQKHILFGVLKMKNCYIYENILKPNAAEPRTAAFFPFNSETRNFALSLYTGKIGKIFEEKQEKGFYIYFRYEW